MLPGIPVTGSVSSLCYCLRIVALLARPGGAFGRAAVPARRHSVLAALVLLLIGPGACSAPLLTLIHATASMAAR